MVPGMGRMIDHGRMPDEHRLVEFRRRAGARLVGIGTSLRLRVTSRLAVLECVDDLIRGMDDAF